MTWIARILYALFRPQSQPWLEGDDAYRSGKAPDRNPYDPGSESWRQWNLGYKGQRA